MSVHAIRCKLTGEKIGLKLDGAWCACSSANECCLAPKPVRRTKHHEHTGRSRCFANLAEAYRVA